MRKADIVALLLLCIGLATGCNRGRDTVLSDGTKVFGERTLKDGTIKRRRVESPNGITSFDVTILPDGTKKAQRAEDHTGGKSFDITILPDGTGKIARIESQSGAKSFDVTVLPDGTQTAGRDTNPDGTEAHRFWSAQNDEQGYADVKWGTAITDLDPNATGNLASCFFSNGGDRQENEVVAAALGTSTRDTVVAGTVLSTSMDFSVVPTKCKSITKGDVALVFYYDRFAMAFTHLNAHNYDAIASEMMSKFPEVGSRTATWGGGAMSDGDSTSLSIRVFKRGDTNTRIFLLKRSDHLGCCGTDISSVYLLYVPNFYYEKIQEDISKLKGEQRAQKIAEQNKTEQPDLQKIQ
jgi:hypothetical protein